ncbi:MAG: hypothetical protein PHC86_07060 [Eubacteriales bacterium]|nr:hypothetical protein [Eubacteriales bacterium]
MASEINTTLAKVKKADGLSTLHFRLQAYRWPVSELESLLDLIASPESEADHKMLAARILKVRLHLRLAGPLWQLYQDQPQLIPVQFLLLTLTKHPPKLKQASPRFLDLLASVEQTPDGFCQGDMAQLLTRDLLTVLENATCQDVIDRYQLNASRVFCLDVLTTYFAQCPVPALQSNLGVLRAYFSQFTVDDLPLSVLNHYLENTSPVAIDDPIGLHVSDLTQKISLKARQRLVYWQILHSLRQMLVMPRHLELISRYYYLFQQPARRITDQYTVITLKSLVIFIPDDQELLYVYTAKLFQNTEKTYRSLCAYYDEANATADVDSVTIKAAKWPFEQSLMMPARQALLNEQEKTAQEQTLVEELVHNKKASIIQLSVDDAHYLFARKLLDDIAAFEGAMPIN